MPPKKRKRPDQVTQSKKENWTMKEKPNKKKIQLASDRKSRLERDILPTAMELWTTTAAEIKTTLQRDFEVTPTADRTQAVELLNNHLEYLSSSGPGLAAASILLSLSAIAEFEPITWEDFTGHLNAFDKILRAACLANATLIRVIEEHLGLRVKEAITTFHQNFTASLLAFVHSRLRLAGSEFNGLLRLRLHDPAAVEPPPLKSNRLSGTMVKEVAVLIAGCLETLHYNHGEIRLNASESMTFVGYLKPLKGGEGLVGIPREENKFLPSDSLYNMKKVNRLYVTSGANFVHCDRPMFIAYLVCRILLEHRHLWNDKKHWSQPLLHRARAMLAVSVLGRLFQRSKLDTYPSAIAVYGTALSLVGDQMTPPTGITGGQSEVVLFYGIRISKGKFKDAYMLPYCALADHFSRNDQLRPALVALLYASAVATVYNFLPSLDQSQETELIGVVRLAHDIMKRLGKQETDKFAACHAIGILDNLYYWANNCISEHADREYDPGRNRLRESLIKSLDLEAVVKTIIDLELIDGVEFTEDRGDTEAVIHVRTSELAQRLADCQNGPCARDSVWLEPTVFVRSSEMIKKFIA